MAKPTYDCCDPRNPDYGKPYEGPWTGTHEALQSLIRYVLTRPGEWKPVGDRIPSVPLAPCPGCTMNSAPDCLRCGAVSPVGGRAEVHGG